MSEFDPLRRCDIGQMIPEERALYDALAAVEKLGAHWMLTSVVCAISEAQRKLADWRDSGRPGAYVMEAAGDARR